ncbi:hypothetical protein O3G_MSEX008860 [Manduca sexta]|uniref:Uncharacterized protein n=1 Tax=Manduca sexta TaxID=7130 RepID=A0A921ZC48_MANSE|nr:hypothetical protein O3G_MSEX008860 [Manduca sexta]
MKVVFVVLLLAAAVLAKQSLKSHTVSVHADGPVCQVGEDCEKLCDLQCYNSVEGLCIDGTCMCEVEPIQSSRRRLLKMSKGH